MPVKGKTVMVDIGQLGSFSGTLNQASWDVLNTDTGAIQEITADQIAGTGGPTEFYQLDVTINCDTIEIPELAGVNVKAIWRGTPWRVIKTGLPNGFQVKADIDTDPTRLIISVNSSEFTAFQEEEFILIAYSLL